MVATTVPGPRAYLATAEAAAMLAVSPARVRALIARGDLPATKVGRMWLVDRTAVELRLDLEPRPGRTFAPAMAWGLLFLSEGRSPEWLSRQDRWRLKGFLPRLWAGDLRDRMVQRGRRRAYHIHPGLIESLREDEALMLTGVSASAPLRLGLVGGQNTVEAYVDEAVIEAIEKRHYLGPADEANVILRVVPSFGWTWPDRHVAPPAAVALDLLERPEPRAKQVGRELLQRDER